MGKHLKDTLGDGHSSAAIKRLLQVPSYKLQIWASRRSFTSAAIPCFLLLVYSPFHEPLPNL